MGHEKHSLAIDSHRPNFYGDNMANRHHNSSLDLEGSSLHSNELTDDDRGRPKLKSSGTAFLARRSKSATKKRDTSPNETTSSSMRNIRSGSLRSGRSKSMSSLFHKTFSLRKKRNPYCPQTELSTDDAAPGVLRIFGDSVSPDTHYKSVLAMKSSTALDIVKEALDRYSITIARYPEYVLCDVIGRLVTYDISGDIIPSKGSDDEFWLEDCIRVIGSNEKPLILQSYWKPGEGYARRFELRLRSDLFALERANASIEANRLAIKMDSDVKKSGTKMDSKLNQSVDVSNVRSYPSVDLHQYGFNHGKKSEDINKGNESDRSVQDISAQYTRMDKLHKIKDNSGSKQVSNSSHGLAVPSEPYLLNIKGCKQGSLLWVPLAKELTIGRNENLLAKSDLCLDAKDILARHCLLRTNKAEKCVEIECFDNAPVKINNAVLQGKGVVVSGDIISIGQTFVFIYRDPSIEQELQEDNCDVIKTIAKALTPSQLHISAKIYNECDGNYLSCKGCLKQKANDSLEDADRESEIVRSWRMQRNEVYENDEERLKLSYVREREDDLLERCLVLMDRFPNTFALTPSYLMGMIIEYSTVKYSQTHTRQLLLKLANCVQNAVWEKTKQLAEKQSNGSDKTVSKHERLWPDLVPVIMWMSNGLELFHFLHKNLPNVIMDASVSLTPGCRRSLVEAEEEVLATLEDVVMYTFQQTVYYLTKTLYIVLPAIFDSNPFSQADDTSVKSQDMVTMDTLVEILQTTLNLLVEYKLHPQVLSQLYCYLFFFMSTSLFNSLMGKEAGAKYFKWSKSVQLRGNLDVIESWAAENHLLEEAGLYLRKVNCLVDLLAMPRVQLQQANWESLQRDFPALNPTQLRHVLSNPHLASSKTSWIHSEGKTKTDGELTENFQNHPPLVLPESGYCLNLALPVDDPVFREILTETNITFSQTEDDGDSGLSMSHNTMTSTSIPQATMYTSDGNPQTDGRRHFMSETTSEYATATESLSNSPENMNGGHKHGHGGARSKEVNKVKSKDKQKSKSRSRSKSEERKAVDFSTNIEGVGNVRATSDKYSVQGGWENHVGSLKYELQAPNNEAVSNALNASYEQYDLPDVPTRMNMNEEEIFVHHKDITPRSGKRANRQPVEHGYIEKGNAQRRYQMMQESRYKCEDHNVPVSSPHSSSGPFGSDHVYHSNGQEALQSRLAGYGGVRSRYPVNGYEQGYTSASSTPREVPSPREQPSKGILRNVPPLDLSSLEEGYPDSSPEAQDSDTKPEIPPRNGYRYVNHQHVRSSDNGEDASARGLGVQSSNPYHMASLQDQKTSNLSKNSDARMKEFLTNRTQSSNAFNTNKKSYRSHEHSEKDRINNDSTNYNYDNHSYHAISYNNQHNIAHCSSRSDVLFSAGENVMSVELSKTEHGLGLGLIDGLYTSLQARGIYVRTLVPGGAAARDARLQLGDRILAVGATNVVDSDYQTVMDMIKKEGQTVHFTVAKTDRITAMKITASAC